VCSKAPGEIRNCVFTANGCDIGTADGARYLEHARSVADCLFENNTGDEGGANHSRIRCRLDLPDLTFIGKLPCPKRRRPDAGQRSAGMSLAQSLLELLRGL
jgi:hypothetical protein